MSDSNISTESPFCNNQTECKKDMRLNVTGIGISLLCLVHCMATPVLAGYISVKSAGMYHSIDYVFIAVALGIIFMITRKMNHLWITAGLWAGAGLIIYGIIFAHHSHTAVHWTLYAGSGLLVLFHLINVVLHYSPGLLPIPTRSK
jgi:hypothetical protein